MNVDNSIRKNKLGYLINMSTVDEDISDSLCAAVELGRSDVIRNLLSSSTAEEEKFITAQQLLCAELTDDGTLLHFASKLGQADIVRTLLSAGADPGILNADGISALDLALSEKVLGVFNQELLQAIAQSNIGRVCQLLAAGVNVNLIDSPESCNTPLHWAASYSQREVIQCLCDQGALVNVMNAKGCTPLHDAVIRGDGAIVEELMSFGSDPSLKAVSGQYANKSSFDLAPDSILQKVMERGQISPTLNDSIDDIDINNLNINTRSSSFDFPAKILPNDTVESVTSSVDDDGSSTTVGKINEKNANDPSTVSDVRLHLLWPTPQKLVQREGKPFKVSTILKICIVPGPAKESVQQAMHVWKLKKRLFEDLGYSLDIQVQPSCYKLEEPHIVCHINSRMVNKSEGYSISVSDNAVQLLGFDAPGLFYGTCTLLQLLKMCNKEGGIPSLKITDYPTLSVRGVLFDLYKGRLPTLDTLKESVELLSALKINQLHFYTRFTKPTNQGWQLPYSNLELLELEKFCLDRFVSLIPVIDVCSKVAIDDINELYYTFQEFINAFSHASCVNIGPRLSSFLLDSTDDDFLFVDDAHRLLPLSPSHTVQICAFVYHGGIDLMPNLPLNSILMEYGFQADYAFSKYCKEYEECGLPFIVCPGTSTWNSISGCPEATLSNIFKATQAAVNHNALGMVLCNWSGVNHLNHQPYSWTGYIVGAGLAWNPTVQWEYLHSNLAKLMNVHIFQDSADKLGQVIIELGRAETYVVRCSTNQSGKDLHNLPSENGSALFRLICNPEDVSLESLPAEVFQKTMRHIRKCVSELQTSTPSCYQHSDIIREVTLSSDLMMFACKVGRALSLSGKNPSSTAGLDIINAGITNLPATAKTDLANRLLGLKEQFKSVWMLRQLPECCEDTMSMFIGLFKRLVPDQQSS